MAYIEVIEEDAAEGRLREVYDDIIQKRGKLSQVLKIQSLNPESIQRHVDLYMQVMFGRSPLRRAQREMLAVVVSLANDCAYCVAHHAAALDHFWKDHARVQALQDDFRKADLSDTDILLCAYAEQLTRTPGESSPETIADMKAAGLTDQMILDASLVISYFNFVNRMVLGLGVKLEVDHGEGFKYD